MMHRHVHKTEMIHDQVILNFQFNDNNKFLFDHFGNSEDSMSKLVFFKGLIKLIQ